ncbi:VOC family protein [Cytobacillus gottheilii]|uniref:VOC family protein n=1 Tax=Cytobacillus gottheilii TaxID=859144 RepID=UPI000834377E|nr:VOC family protein [Cytobacillus gottheilii]
MNITLDHVVHFIAETPQNIVDTFQNKGIHAVAGGSHQSWGTYNSLLYTASSYIEFFAIEHDEIAAESDNPLVKHLREKIKKKEGIGQICFRTDNINNLQQHLHNQDLKTLPIFDGSRVRDDGKRIQWKMLFIEETDPSIPFPFFIEWAENDDIRLAELKNSGFIHPTLENSYIELIQWPVPDYKQAARSLSPLFQEKMVINDAMQITQITAGKTKIQLFSEDGQESLIKECKIKISPPLKNGPLYVNGVVYE